MKVTGELMDNTTQSKKLMMEIMGPTALVTEAIVLSEASRRLATEDIICVITGLSLKRVRSAAKTLLKVGTVAKMREQSTKQNAYTIEPTVAGQVLRHAILTWHQTMAVHAIVGEAMEKCDA